MDSLAVFFMGWKINSEFWVTHPQKKTVRETKNWNLTRFGAPQKIQVREHQNLKLTRFGTPKKIESGPPWEGGF